MKLSAPERRLLVEAFCWLGIFRLAILLLPFRWVAPRLGKPGVAVAENEQSGDFLPLDRIAWAIKTASAHTPWRSECLVQAMAGKQMLQVRGVSSTLYLGLKHGEEESMLAHAWLVVGSKVLTGEQGIENFKVVSTFT